MSNSLELQTENYSASYQAAHNKAVVTLVGTFDLMAAEPLGGFLAKLRQRLAIDAAVELVFEVSDLLYLASSCMKDLIGLVVDMRGRFDGFHIWVLTNPRLDWQERTFSTLKRLAPGIVSVKVHEGAT